MKNEYLDDIRMFVGTGSLSRAVYSKSTCIVSVKKGALGFLVSCGHEIMHLYFRKFYFDAISNILSKLESRELNEALTVLLNEEFKD